MEPKVYQASLEWNRMVIQVGERKFDQTRERFEKESHGKDIEDVESEVKVL